MNGKCARTHHDAIPDDSPPFCPSGAGLALLATGILAQQPATDKPVLTMHVQAREVLLPVTVRDKHGALVTNLHGRRLHADRGRPSAGDQEPYAREQPALPAGAAGGYQPQHDCGAMENERKAAGKFVDLMLPADAKAARQGPGLPHPL